LPKQARKILYKEIKIMTGFNNNNKFVPRAQTYEIRYVDLEVKEPSKISKLADYLGVKKVENYGSSVSIPKSAVLDGGGGSNSSNSGSGKGDDYDPFINKIPSCTIL